MSSTAPADWQSKDEILTGTITSDYSEPGINSNVEGLHIPHGFRIENSPCRTYIDFWSKFLNTSISHMDMILTGITIPGQSGPESNDNEGTIP